jgi:hypothetical protein
LRIIIVETTDDATINMMQLKYVPVMFNILITGSISPTIVANIVIDNIMVTPNDNFSPESGGSVKPKTAIDAIRTHGTIKLKK